MDNAMISSEKIMQKLKEIKRTFVENPTESEMMQPYLRTSEVQSRENERFRKYLPESMVKFSAERPEVDYESRQPDTRVRQRETEAITFRKSLENKLENLFNEEKNILRRRYEISHDADDYQRSLRDLENKYERHQIGSDPVADNSFKSHGDHIKQMEDKIKELERKYRQGQRNPQLPPPPNNENLQRSGRKRKSKDNQQWRHEMTELREELLALKRANLKLKNQMNRRQVTFEASKLIEHRTEVEKSLLKEVEKLKKQIEELKETRSPKKKDICQARTASRQRAQSQRQSKQRKKQEESMLQLYSQIDQLKYKLNREAKQKMLLQQRNSWLEQQLNNLLSK